jgi:hypothetical protein
MIESSFSKQAVSDDRLYHPVARIQSEDGKKLAHLVSQVYGKVFYFKDDTPSENVQYFLSCTRRGFEESPKTVHEYILREEVGELLDLFNAKTKSEFLNRLSISPYLPEVFSQERFGFSLKSRIDRLGFLLIQLQKFPLSLWPMESKEAVRTSLEKVFFVKLDDLSDFLKKDNFKKIIVKIWSRIERNSWLYGETPILIMFLNSLKPLYSNESFRKRTDVIPLNVLECVANTFLNFENCTLEPELYCDSLLKAQDKTLKFRLLAGNTKAIESIKPCISTFSSNLNTHNSSQGEWDPFYLRSVMDLLLGLYDRPEVKDLLGDPLYYLMKKHILIADVRDGLEEVQRGSYSQDFVDNIISRAEAFYKEDLSDFLDDQMKEIIKIFSADSSTSLFYNVYTSPFWKEFLPHSDNEKRIDALITACNPEASLQIFYYHLKMLIQWIRGKTDSEFREYLRSTETIHNLGGMFRFCGFSTSEQETFLDIFNSQSPDEFLERLYSSPLYPTISKPDDELCHIKNLLDCAKKRQGFFEETTLDSQSDTFISEVIVKFYELPLKYIKELNVEINKSISKLRYNSSAEGEILKLENLKKLMRNETVDKIDFNLLDSLFKSIPSYYFRNGLLYNT